MSLIQRAKMRDLSMTGTKLKELSLEHIFTVLYSCFFPARFFLYQFFFHLKLNVNVNYCFTTEQVLIKVQTTEFFKDTLMS